MAFLPTANRPLDVALSQAINSYAAGDSRGFRRALDTRPLTFLRATPPHETLLQDFLNTTHGAVLIDCMHLIFHVFFIRPLIRDDRCRADLLALWPHAWPWIQYVCPIRPGWRRSQLEDCTAEGFKVAAEAAVGCLHAFLATDELTERWREGCHEYDGCVGWLMGVHIGWAEHKCLAGAFREGHTLHDSLRSYQHLLVVALKSAPRTSEGLATALAEGMNHRPTNFWRAAAAYICSGRRMLGAGTEQARASARRAELELVQKVAQVCGCRALHSCRHPRSLLQALIRVIYSTRDSQSLDLTIDHSQAVGVLNSVLSWDAHAIKLGIEAGMLALLCQPWPAGSEMEDVRMLADIVGAAMVSRPVTRACAAAVERGDLLLTLGDAWGLATRAAESRALLDAFRDDWEIVARCSDSQVGPVSSLPL